MRFSTRRAAESQLKKQGFLPIGRGQFTRRFELAHIEKMPTRGFKICMTVNN